MNLNQTLVSGAVSLVLACALCGCTGSEPPTTPTASNPTGSVNHQASDAHALWGMWWVYADPANHLWEIVPAREPTFHANIRHFLEDGTPCDDCLKITGITPNPDGTRSVDIRITHPWTGLDTFTGFDTRAIAMFNGSQVWPASGLRTQDPEGTDGYVLNADGYTTIYNPTTFPPGSGKPLFTYTKGSFASDTSPDSTLNPFIDYWTSENRRMFRAGESVTRTWQIRFPSGGPFVLGYAVDSCWELPDPRPPTNLPDDFPIEANRPEPYRIEVSQQGELSTAQGAAAGLVVRAWDWQMNPSGVRVECPELWTGMKSDSTRIDGPDYVTFTIPIENEAGSGRGLYRALIAAEDSTIPAPPVDFISYAFYDIEVVLDCCLVPPVALIDNPPTDVCTDEEIALLSASYDPESPDCPLDLYWDLDGDGEFDDAFDGQVSTSWSEPGVYEVGLKAVDECDAENITVAPITVHVCVTQPEDAAYRTIGVQYSFVSADILAADAAFAVDLKNPGGPWDFTALPLTDIGNYQAMLGPDDPEVAGFKDGFTLPYEHFYKNKGTYTMSGDSVLQGEAYFAMGYGTDLGSLLSVGFHHPDQLGTVNLNPPMEMAFPFWIFSEDSVTIEFPPIFFFGAEVQGWGEGIVTLPYDGGTTEPCVVLKYELILDSVLGKGSGLIYQWLLDDGTVVAAVVAGNVLGETNYDPDTGEVTGIASFNALNEIGAYVP